MAFSERSPDDSNLRAEDTACREDEWTPTAPGCGKLGPQQPRISRGRTAPSTCEGAEDGAWQRTPLLRTWHPPTLSPWGPLPAPAVGLQGQPPKPMVDPFPPRPPPVCLALLGSLARGQNGVGNYEDRRPPWVLCLDLFAAALGLRGAKQAVALDCLDGVQEGGAGDP